jgi:hypothetical protein
VKFTHGETLTSRGFATTVKKAFEFGEDVEVATQNSVCELSQLKMSLPVNEMRW